MPEPRLIQVTGMNQCGKSTLVRSLVTARPRVIIVEPWSTNNYDALPFQSVDVLKDALRDRRPRTFRVKVPVMTEDEIVKVCKLAWVVAPVTLVFDETTNLFRNPNNTPREFNVVSQGGAHALNDEGTPVSVIAIGQRPFNLPPVFRSEAEHWYLFRLNSRRDRKLLEDDMGLDRDTSERAGRLPRFHYMHVDRFGGVEHGKTAA